MKKQGFQIISIDVGSTFTKGAAFGLEDGTLALLDRAACPTTVSDLKEGFHQVRERLDPHGRADRVAFSSSAKGGLAISAVGLVPDLTLKAAKAAALSAGGKVVSVHAYKLTNGHMEELAALGPDILLLAGGTDGGNEAFVRHNVGMIRRLPAMAPKGGPPSVVYAGNAALAEEVGLALAAAGLDVYLAPNLLPQVDQMAPEGAREKIREVFLRTIVRGKGLDAIQSQIGAAPVPTPLAALTLVEAIRREAPGFGDFVLVDMGGATTDVYSAGGSIDSEARVVLRGLAEPEVKRTVEGDLGMRVSAVAATQGMGDALPLFLEDQEKGPFLDYVARWAAMPGHLPTDPAEARFDAALASLCIHGAVQRHAGTWRRVFTAMGETFVQQGKDLRRVPTLVGTGGYLGAMAGFVPSEPGADPASETISLVPRGYRYLRDHNYIFPLLGALAVEYPRQAAICALANLAGPGGAKGPWP